MPENQLNSGDVPIVSWLDTWSTHVESWSGACLIKYEDLLTAPVENFTKLLEAYSIPINDEKVEKAVDLCRLDRLMKQEDADGFTEKANQEKFFGQGKGWQNTLTDKQVRRIEEDHGSTMESLGYKLEFL